VNRSVAFVHRYLGGVVPALEAPNALDQQMLAAVAAAPAQIGALIDGYRFRDAGAALMGLARQANKYFNDSAPWASRTSDPARCAATLHVALQVAAALSILAEPFLPFTAAKLRAMLGVAAMRSSDRAGGAGLGWGDSARPLLAAGAPLGPAEVLVQKIEDSAIAAQLAKLEAARAQAQVAAPAAPYTPLAAPITIDDFTKLDLRVGLVKHCEPVPKSKKLLRCEVDLGFETRQVLAGVAEHLTPNDLIGTKVVVVANLAPRVMLGLESRGMLLMAKDRAGKLVPVSTTGEPGSTVA
jgi:methionyl-tRNA synthetase